jgi:E3 ubiquitin-protein ligase RNF14
MEKPNPKVISMEDKEAQDDELLALANIFDQDIYQADEEKDKNELPGGTFTILLHLPHSFVLIIQASGCIDKEILVRYLPPVRLYFQLPYDYPSSSPPLFALSCIWLSLSQLRRLCFKLDDIWEENRGEVIFFHWTNFLQNNVLDFLEITSPLNLSAVLCTRKSSTPPPNDIKECDTSNSNTNTCYAGISGSEIKPRVEEISDESWEPRAIQQMSSQTMLLPAILDFDAKQAELKFHKTPFTCEVCFTEKVGKLCFKFHGCDHVYCKECMRRYFEVQIKDGNVTELTCPYSTCDSQANPTQVKELVPENLFVRYDRLLLQSSLDTMTDVMYCSRNFCGCAVMVDQEFCMGSCPACYYVFCIFCKRTFHGLSPCGMKEEQMKVLRDEYIKAVGQEKLQLERRYGKRLLRTLVEDSLSEEWLHENSKKCPHCSTHIQKIDGCNKMTCTKCRALFCWLCNTRLSRNNPYSHYNVPGNTCFNQLFQGVNVEELGPNEEWPVWV